MKINKYNWIISYNNKKWRSKNIIELFFIIIKIKINKYNSIILYKNKKWR